MTETVPKRFIPLCIAGLLIFDQFQNNIIPTFYFVYVSKNWYYLCLIITLVCSVPQVVLVYYLPDSPVLYYEENDFVDAKRIYKDIAMHDGKKMLSFKFDEEVKEEESHVAHETIKITIMDFLRHKTIWSNFIIFLIFYLTQQFNSYLIGFNMKYIQGSFFANWIFWVFAYIIANILTP